jgi:hypothetical protein
MFRIVGLIDNIKDKEELMDIVKVAITRQHIIELNKGDKK